MRLNAGCCFFKQYLLFSVNVLLVGFEQQSKQLQPFDDKCWQGDNHFDCLLIPIVRDGLKKILRVCYKLQWNNNIGLIVYDETRLVERVFYPD